MTALWFIEKLTISNWLFQIVPLVLKNRGVALYVFDGSAVALRIAQGMGRFLGIEVMWFPFRLIDVRDERNLLVWLRVRHQDFLKMVIRIEEDKFKLFFQGRDFLESRLLKYLSKEFSAQAVHGRNTFSHCLLLVQLIIWKLRNQEQKDFNLVLFLHRRFGIDFIQDYASQYGVVIKRLFFGKGLEWKQPWMVPLYRKVMYFLWYWRYAVFRRAKGGVPLVKPSQGPKIAVECYHHSNLNHPEIFSDFFFLQQSGLSGKDCVATFNVPNNPLDLAKALELSRHHITILPLRPEATRFSECPPFNPTGPLFLKRKKRDSHPHSLSSLEERWLRQRTAYYEMALHFWRELFDQFQCRIFVSWYKYAPSHCAIADAMEATGGVTALYQRGFETNPSPIGLVRSDLFFGFSKFSAEIEKKSQSVIPYFVVTGYLGDHRFALLRNKAKEIRETLSQQGVKHILSFTDENSHDEERWLLGHTVTRKNYTFLLEKVLTNPWLGLVLKPKIPSTLQRRLGPVGELLRQAIKSGRCILFEEGSIHGSYPPAVAALSSDIAIHGHLCAPTAGLEAALTGTPALYMDREGWKESPLYRLGEGKVVFNDWESLWEACETHWHASHQISKLGDWGSMLDQLDPFRDGQAAKRMGTYLQWILEGFRAGLSRETVLADAAARYAEQWGTDKVLSVNADSKWAMRSVA